MLPVVAHALRPRIDGRLPAVYVMVLADGQGAKVGALEAAANAPVRLKRVQEAHRRREPGAAYPMRLVVVLEIADLAISGDHDVDSEERWAEVEHLEAALRLSLARRVGRLARWADWIHVDRALDDTEWVGVVQTAWTEVTKIGRNDAAIH